MNLLNNKIDLGQLWVEFTSDKILGIGTDNPVKYLGHGKKYPEMVYRDNKIIFIEPKKETNEQPVSKEASSKN
jgi:non-canonical (house-cleaning) NTP pyrophosphatase